MIFGSLKAQLDYARQQAELRPPGLVTRNWDYEHNVVTIDHDAAASDLAIQLTNEFSQEVSLADAKLYLKYALEGNTEAVLT